jgi:hypothetical protein
MIRQLSLRAPVAAWTAAAVVAVAPGCARRLPRTTPQLEQACCRLERAAYVNLGLAAVAAGMAVWYYIDLERGAIPPDGQAGLPLIVFGAGSGIFGGFAAARFRSHHRCEGELDRRRALDAAPPGWHELGRPGLACRPSLVTDVPACDRGLRCEAGTCLAPPPPPRAGEPCDRNRDTNEIRCADGLSCVEAICRPIR